MSDTSNVNAPDISPTANNFDLLRLVACMSVIYGNGLLLTGAPVSALWGAPVARFGLDFLFALSGYLVAGSWLRDPAFLPFLTRRTLRIMPGMIGCVIFTVAVIGPYATRLSFHQYVLNSMTLRYLKNMAFMQQLWLPAVFQGQGWAGAVNPMLWTLLLGLLCCLVLPVLELLPNRLRIWALAGVAGLFAAMALCLPPDPNLHFYHVLLKDMLVEIPFFLVGALLRHMQNRMSGLWRADVAMLFFAGNWVVATWLGAWNILLEWVSLPYMAACFGHMSAPVLSQIGRWGNPSYGLYLYAFPIQQLIVANWPDCPHPIMICIMLSLVAGHLSWHIIERPALAWAEPGTYPRLSPGSSRPVRGS